jgi:Acetyltransferase (GNAT) family
VIRGPGEPGTPTQGILLVSRLQAAPGPGGMAGCAGPEGDIDQRRSVTKTVTQSFNRSRKTTCRGYGLGRRLLAALEHRARELGCCRLTLEVQENNRRVRAIYGHGGFVQAVYVAEGGGSLSMAKQL